jgi:hypothetical protein
MSPFLSSLIGAGVRWLITVAAARGVAVSDDQATQIALGVVTLVPLLWSWWQKAQADRKLASAKAGV